MSENETIKRRKKKLLVSPSVIIIIASIVVAAVAAFVFLKPGGKSNDTVPALEAGQSATRITMNKADLKKNVTLPGWGTITIDKESATVKVPFNNPEANKDNYYMSFELKVDLKGDGEFTSVYESGLVEPGNYLNQVTLNQPIPEGEYNAIVHIQPYTMTEQPQPTNNGDVKVRLIAK